MNSPPPPPPPPSGSNWLRWTLLSLNFLGLLIIAGVSVAWYFQHGGWIPPLVAIFALILGLVGWLPKALSDKLNKCKIFIWEKTPSILLLSLVVSSYSSFRTTVKFLSTGAEQVTIKYGISLDEVNSSDDIESGQSSTHDVERGEKSSQAEFSLGLSGSSTRWLRREGYPPVAHTLKRWESTDFHVETDFYVGQQVVLIRPAQDLLDSTSDRQRVLVVEIGGKSYEMDYDGQAVWVGGQKLKLPTTLRDPDGGPQAAPLTGAGATPTTDLKTPRLTDGDQVVVSIYLYTNGQRDQNPYAATTITVKKTQTPSEFPQQLILDAEHD